MITVMLMRIIMIIIIMLMMICLISLIIILFSKGYKSDVVNRINTPLNETTEFSSDPCCSFLNLEETEDNDQNDGDHHAPVTKSWLNSASNQKK